MSAKIFYRDSFVKFANPSLSAEPRLMQVLEDSDPGKGTTRAKCLDTGETADFFTVHLFKDRDCIHRCIADRTRKINEAKQIGLGKQRRRG